MKYSIQEYTPTLINLYSGTHSQKNHLQISPAKIVKLNFIENFRSLTLQRHCLLNNFIKRIEQQYCIKYLKIFVSILKYFLFSIAGSHKQPSMVSDLRMPAESDNESMADYADGVGDGES